MSSGKANKNTPLPTRYNHLDALGGIKLKVFLPPPKAPSTTRVTASSKPPKGDPSKK